MQAALRAVPTNADLGAAAIDGPLQMIGQGWLQLLVGGWQKLSPARVPHTVHVYLHHSFMGVVTCNLEALMGLVGPDVGLKTVRLLPAHGHKQTPGASMVSRLVVSTLCVSLLCMLCIMCQAHQKVQVIMQSEVLPFSTLVFVSVSTPAIVQGVHCRNSSEW